MRTTLSKLVNIHETARKLSRCSLTTAGLVRASHNSIFFNAAPSRAQSGESGVRRNLVEFFFFRGDTRTVLTGWYKLFIFIYVVDVVSNFIIASSIALSLSPFGFRMPATRLWCIFEWVEKREADRMQLEFFKVFRPSVSRAAAAVSTEISQRADKRFSLVSATAEKLKCRPVHCTSNTIDNFFFFCLYLSFFRLFFFLCRCVLYFFFVSWIDFRSVFLFQLSSSASHAHSPEKFGDNRNNSSERKRQKKSRNDVDIKSSFLIASTSKLREKS